MADAAGQAFEEPDMRTWRRELDVSQPFAPHFGKRDFHSAFIADHASIFHALVFAAQALPVCNRAKDPSTKKSILFRFERTVVDRFGLGHFAARPRPYFFRRCKADSNAVKISAQIRFFHYIFKTSQWAPPQPYEV